MVYSSLPPVSGDGRDQAGYDLKAVLHRHVIDELDDEADNLLEGSRPGPSATLDIRDYRFAGRVLASGDIGFAEGFMDLEYQRQAVIRHCNQHQIRCGKRRFPDRC